ncbi:MAG: NAD(P)-dependent alcohol dehydrogenase [Rhodothermales bacterium]|nr:NAD(P)-dependent alcohol dehydrogenase [Rhodothermales bacterium]MBO6778662.1 NAD(P)-dependent alcohol dehydrogenase [Rhodothermales bacterium]
MNAPLTPTTMRAVIQREYGGPDTLSLSTTQPIPEPGPGEVRVRVHASSVAAGDVHMMTGRPYLIRLFGYGVLAPKYGRPGLDVSGVVDAVGEGVTRFKKGDEVYGELERGAFADYVVGSQDLLARMPKGLTFEQAGAIPTSGMTALAAVKEHGQVTAGDRVLVIGATGGVGHFALQIAVAEGAEVHAVSSERNAPLARELGAAHAFDYRKEDFSSTVAAYDVVIDTAGRLPLGTARRMLRPGGRWVAVSAGNLGDWLGPIPRMLTAAMGNLGKSAKIISFITMPGAEKLEELARRVEQGTLRPVLQETYDLEQAPRALADQASGGARGKRVISVRSAA